MNRENTLSTYMRVQISNAVGMVVSDTPGTQTGKTKRNHDNGKVDIVVGF